MLIIPPSGELANYRGYLDPERVKPREMTEDETLLFALIALMSQASKTGRNVDLMVGDLARETGAVDIFRQRLEMVGIPVNNYLLLFLCPTMAYAGEAVVWAYTVALWTHRLQREVTLDDLSSKEAFGLGLPDPEGMRSVWTAQKMNDGRNALDVMKWWPRRE